MRPIFFMLALVSVFLLPSSFAELPLPGASGSSNQSASFDPRFVGNDPAQYGRNNNTSMAQPYGNAGAGSFGGYQGSGGRPSLSPTPNSAFSFLGQEGGGYQGSGNSFLNTGRSSQGSFLSQSSSGLNGLQWIQMGMSAINTFSASNGSFTDRLWQTAQNSLYLPQVNGLSIAQNGYGVNALSGQQQTSGQTQAANDEANAQKDCTPTSSPSKQNALGINRAIFDAIFNRK